MVSPQHGMVADLGLWRAEGTEQAVCTGLAQLPPASQSKHRPKPRDFLAKLVELGLGGGGATDHRQGEGTPPAWTGLAVGSRWWPRAADPGIGARCTGRGIARERGPSGAPGRARGERTGALEGPLKTAQPSSAGAPSAGRPAEFRSPRRRRWDGPSARLRPFPSARRAGWPGAPWAGVGSIANFRSRSRRGRARATAPAAAYPRVPSRALTASSLGPSAGGGLATLRPESCRSWARAAASRSAPGPPPGSPAPGPRPRPSAGRRCLNPTRRGSGAAGIAATSGSCGAGRGFSASPVCGVPGRAPQSCAPVPQGARFRLCLSRTVAEPGRPEGARRDRAGTGSLGEGPGDYTALHF
nr:translation initiation factor IF-2-like [Gorilla gorilla gorilla]